MSVTWMNLGSVDNIPARGARRLSIGHGGRPVAVFRTREDRFFALIDECPHKRGPLSEGIISGETVTCPLHNWNIGLADGKAAAPDIGCNERLPVRVVDGEIHVGFPQTECVTA